MTFFRVESDAFFSARFAALWRQQRVPRKSGASVVAGTTDATSLISDEGGRGTTSRKTRESTTTLEEVLTYKEPLTSEADVGVVSWSTSLRSPCGDDAGVLPFSKAEVDEMWNNDSYLNIHTPKADKIIPTTPVPDEDQLNTSSAKTDDGKPMTVAQKTEKVIQVLLRAAWKKAELTRVNGSFKKNNPEKIDLSLISTDNEGEAEADETALWLDSVAFTIQPSVLHTRKNKSSTNDNTTRRINLPSEANNNPAVLPSPGPPNPLPSSPPNLQSTNATIPHNTTSRVSLQSKPNQVPTAFVSPAEERHNRPTYNLSNTLNSFPTTNARLNHNPTNNVSLQNNTNQVPASFNFLPPTGTSNLSSDLPNTLNSLPRTNARIPYNSTSNIRPQNNMNQVPAAYNFLPPTGTSNLSYSNLPNNSKSFPMTNARLPYNTTNNISLQNNTNQVPAAFFPPSAGTSSLTSSNLPNNMNHVPTASNFLPPTGTSNLSSSNFPNSLNNSFPTTHTTFPFPPTGVPNYPSNPSLKRRREMDASGGGDLLMPPATQSKINHNSLSHHRRFAPSQSSVIQPTMTMEENGVMMGVARDGEELVSRTEQHRRTVRKGLVGRAWG